MGGKPSQTAEKAGIDCDFETSNILEINPKYCSKFDFIFFTTGAITWLKDLNELFGVVSKCLKPNGILLIHDTHPMMNMLPFPDEKPFDESKLNSIAYSYFRIKPWIENNGMDYISGEYKSKTFTSFSHTISDIFNSIIQSGLEITKLDEFDYDVSITDVYDGRGFLLSFLLTAKKAAK